MPSGLPPPHLQSTWNLSNQFTGWVDVPLTPQGEAEARRAGAIMKSAGMAFDAVHTSVLKRAIKTAWLALEELDTLWLPQRADWRLNERHYGALSGLDKAETAAKYGEAQVGLWRRSYDVPPPPMEKGHPFWVGDDRRYASVPSGSLPATESTETTGARVVPYWLNVLKPAAESGQRLLIVAHGNSLRALVKHIDGISDADIVSLNIPTGVPLVYTFDAQWRPIKHRDAMSGLSGRYLGDLAAIRASIEGVANQSKAKK